MKMNAANQVQQTLHIQYVHILHQQISILLQGTWRTTTLLLSKW